MRKNVSLVIAAFRDRKVLTVGPLSTRTNGKREANGAYSRPVMGDGSIGVLCWSILSYQITIAKYEVGPCGETGPIWITDPAGAPSATTRNHIYGVRAAIRYPEAFWAGMCGHVDCAASAQLTRACLDRGLAIGEWPKILAKGRLTASESHAARCAREGVSL